MRRAVAWSIDCSSIPGLMSGSGWLCELVMSRDFRFERKDRSEGPVPRFYSSWPNRPRERPKMQVGVNNFVRQEATNAAEIIQFTVTACDIGKIIVARSG